MKQQNNTICQTASALKGQLCRLEPLSYNHHNGLIEAVKDGQLWNLWYTTVPEPSQMKKEIDRRLELQVQGLMSPFTIFDAKTDQVVGVTSYLNIDATNHRLEIGGTWIAKSKQRSGINIEAKLLLLTQAFEALRCNAVEFRTHFCNQASRIGIEKLGAKLDGILRNHMIMPNNTLRDTCVYSIIISEWPTIKANLNWRMSEVKETVTV